MHETLTVLPVSKRGARLQAVVGIAGGDEALVVNHLRLGESRLDVPVCPILGRLAHRQPPVGRIGEIGSRPFDRLQLQALRADVAVKPRVRPIGMQALERIDREGQRLQIQLDPLNRVLRRRLIHGRHGENRLADVLRLLGKNRRIRRRHGRYFIRQQHTNHSWHAQSCGHIDAAHERVRHRTGQQAAEHHAIGAEVLRILRLAGDFGHDIGWREILAQQLVGHVDETPAARITPLR